MIHCWACWEQYEGEKCPMCGNGPQKPDEVRPQLPSEIKKRMEILKTRPKKIGKAIKKKVLHE